MVKKEDKFTRSGVPMVIAHIWVGPRPAPFEWMQTWKDKNPEWGYVLWDNDKVFGRTWRNQKHIDWFKERGIWHGVADLIQYEILHENGGFMPGADSQCLLPIDDLFDEHKIYSVYENEKVRPGLISPIHASVPNHEFLNLIIEELKAKVEVGEPWETTGNLYMQEVIERVKPDIKIWPSHTLIPVHYTGEKYDGNEKVYANHLFGTTNALYKRVV